MPEIEQHVSSNPNALLGKYELGRLLGCGAFAKVYHARNLHTGQSVAIKVINKKRLSSAASSTTMSNIKKEISIMRLLHHRHIVHLHEVMATKSKIYFVMELVKGGELFAKVAKGRFPEDLSRKYFHQLISAVGYCHSRGVFHRDLKPENLLVDENGNLKVSDFGLSALADHIKPDGLLHTLCGTPAYVAPEILTKRGYDGAKVDLWSCGVILYVLNAGYLPFNDPNLMAMYRKIYNGEFRCPKWMSPELKHLLKRLLDTNPDTRITIHEILKDPWFKKGYKAFQTDETAFTNNMYQDYYYSSNTITKTSTSSSTSGSNSNSNSNSNDMMDKNIIGELNAFDIISFSAGLDLSGLFNNSRSPVEEDGERFLSNVAAEELMQRVEEFAKEDRLRVIKGKKESGVELEGRNGKLAMEVGVYRLTEDLVVVEVKRVGGDALVYRDVWNDKLKPRLAMAN